MALTVLNQRCQRRLARYLRIHVVSNCFSVSRYDPVSHWCSRHAVAERRLAPSISRRELMQFSAELEMSLKLGWSRLTTIGEERGKV